MSQSPKTLEFLQKLKDSGNWNDEYDYSDVDYILSNQRVNIYCKIHRELFQKTPSKLLSGNANCSKCIKARPKTNKRKPILFEKDSTNYKFLLRFFDFLL